MARAPMSGAGSPTLASSTGSSAATVVAGLRDRRALGGVAVAASGTSWKPPKTPELSLVAPPLLPAPLPPPGWCVPPLLVPAAAAAAAAARRGAGRRQLRVADHVAAVGVLVDVGGDRGQRLAQLLLGVGGGAACRQRAVADDGRPGSRPGPVRGAPAPRRAAMRGKARRIRLIDVSGPHRRGPRRCRRPTRRGCRARRRRAAWRAEARAQRRVVAQALDRAAQRRHVARGHDEPVALGHDEPAGGGADLVGCDDGNASVHGLVGDQPPRLAEGPRPQRRYDQDV